ncbi:RNA polymerase factor sigma C [Effusibacillus lacus]|uniref:RNA polymerase sigma factor n=2 Tax=Effusibacillus lacus TaxID=1348429 RepID=A0A292YJ52_9BACL|nr:RNA polymerase factor sigma C [Effusibacillus lacus]
MNEQILGHKQYYHSVWEDRYAQLEELMSEYGQDVINLAYSYVKDRMQAEDIAQDAFLKAFAHLDRFQYQSSLKTWIYRITINCAKDHLRSALFRKLLPSADPLSLHSQASASAEEQVMDSIFKKLIWDAVFQLPVKYREVVVLYYREGFPISEISEILGIKEETARTRLKRAREKLETQIGRKVNDDNGPV